MNCYKDVVKCKMADFQNRLISLPLSVFSSGLLHRTTLMFL